jgi:hypothetical protein
MKLSFGQLARKEEKKQPSAVSNPKQFSFRRFFILLSVGTVCLTILMAAIAVQALKAPPDKTWSDQEAMDLYPLIRYFFPHSL